eukprot:GEMP01028337.1.p1 GENE.GEMP01028337.1~~GEMP01028337.1.p1  ORF type:complete len:366 (+),score=65.15 GEMP01028337.1:180-1277(+)
MPEHLKTEKTDILDNNVQNEFEASDDEGFVEYSDNNSISSFEEPPAHASEKQKVAGVGQNKAIPRSERANLAPFRGSEVKLAMLLSSIDVMDELAKRDFMMSPVPPGVWLECQIIRIPTGPSKFSRKFNFYTGSGKFLAVCEKGPHSRTAHYSVSTDSWEAKKDHPCYVGKIRSNFLGTEFMGYAPGLNPSKMSNSHRGGLQLSEMVREEMVSISYESHMFSMKFRPQSMNVVLPHVEADAHGQGCRRTPCKAVAPKADGLRALTEFSSQTTTRRGTQPLVRTYVNKPAKWSQRAKSYVLDFNGRVSHPSVKNFQLVQSDNANDIYLQFGRYGANKFNLDFGFPFSPFQALSIAISSLDYKISSE